MFSWNFVATMKTILTLIILFVLIQFSKLYELVCNRVTLKDFMKKDYKPVNFENLYAKFDLKPWNEYREDLYSYDLNYGKYPNWTCDFTGSFSSFEFNSKSKKGILWSYLNNSVDCFMYTVKQHGKVLFSDEEEKTKILIGFRVAPNLYCLGQIRGPYFASLRGPKPDPKALIDNGTCAGCKFTLVDLSDDHGKGFIAKGNYVLRILCGFVIVFKIIMNGF